jgi:hypothetical protein
MVVLVVLVGAFPHQHKEAVKGHITFQFILDLLRAVDCLSPQWLFYFMSSTASYCPEAALPIIMPPLISPDGLNNVYLPEIEDHSSTSNTHPTTYSATDTFTAIDEMGPKLFQDDQDLESTDSDSDATVGTKSSPYRYQQSLQDDIHHEDLDNSDDSFRVSKKPSMKERTARPKLSQNFDASASSPTSPALTQAKGIPKVQSRQDGKAKERAHANLSSSPTKKQPQADRAKRRKSNRSNSPESAPQDAKQENIEEDREEEEKTPASSRSLRRRTIQQTHPYKFDRIQHDLMKSSGTVALADEVEDVIQEEIQSTQKPNPRKKARLSTGSSKSHNAKATTSKSQKPKRRRSGSLLSIASSAPSPEFERTTLQIWLDGFKDAAAPISLSKVDDVDQLIEFINEIWGWKFEGQRFSYAIASFPWLSDGSNILIRSGMKDSFQKLMQQVKAAPVWAEGGDGAICEVKIMVYVQV